MEHDEQTKVTLVRADERWPLALDGAVLFYRRVSLGVLAALERQQAQTVFDPQSHAPRQVISPAALEAAICRYALVDWQGVSGPDGAAVAFERHAAQALPAGARARLVAAAMDPNPPRSET